MTQHSVRVDDLSADVRPRRLTTRFAGFEAVSMVKLAEVINAWLEENPDAKIIGWQHSFGIAAYPTASEIVEQTCTAMLEYRS
jgi:hypothetical protein